MLDKTFTSQPFLYRLPSAIPPGSVFNPYLTTPPRIYGEEWDPSAGPIMFVVADTAADGYESIYLWMQQKQVYAPGFNFVLYKWNGTTGAYVGAIYPNNSPTFPSPKMLSQGRDGTLWLLNPSTRQAVKATVDPVLGVVPYTGGTSSGEIVTTSVALGTTYPLGYQDVTTFTDLKQKTVGGSITTLVLGTDYTVNMSAGLVTVLNTSPNVIAGSTLIADYNFGEWVYDFSAFLLIVSTFNIDPETDTLLTGDTSPELHVWNLNEGTKRVDIPLPGIPNQIMVIDQTRCYVMTQLNLVALVDYSAGKVLSVLNCQENPISSTVGTVTWDWIFQRFLCWTYTPIATNGQNTSVVNGYFPIPQPTGITAPIPLQPPRQYRQTPIYTRIYGDAGEPYPGGQVTISPSSGLAVVTGFPALTDIDGESVATISDAGAGSVTLTATANIT